MGLEAVVDSRGQGLHDGRSHRSHTRSHIALEWSHMNAPKTDVQEERPDNKTLSTFPSLELKVEAVDDHAFEDDL